MLGAWYGELALEPVDPPASLRAFDDTHEWCARRIPAAGAIADPIEVVVMVGFPRRPEIPLARGFAGRATLEDALEAAAGEAWQSLAFVWDEPVPEAPPELAPTPLFHLDYYLWPGHHELLRAWLDTPAPERAPAARHEETRFLDLTPDDLDGLFVARALRASARELVFGEAPDEIRASLPPARHVHPIP